jgi:RNA polymerase sigma factor (sigma-70 family)
MSRSAPERTVQSVTPHPPGDDAPIDLAGEYDIVVLDAYVRGRQDGFDELYARHAGAVLRFAWSMVGTRAAAEDLMQETFLTLWAKRRSVRLIDDSLLPWLLATCRNHARNLLRRTARTAALPLDEAVATGAPDGTLVFDLLAGLSDTDRVVARLCLVDGYSYREAARLLETTTTAVGKRLQRARTRIREAMADE